MKRQLLKERNPFFVSAGPGKLCVCLWCAYFVRSLCARFAWQQQQHLHIYYLFMCGCVCVCFCVSAFMPCINVTMHHLCHLLSAHKCKIWVLLTQRLCPNRRAPPPSPESHALWPSNFVALSVYLLSLPTAHTHKLPHTRVYRNRIAQPKLRLSVSRPTFSLLPVLANEFLWPPGRCYINTSSWAKKAVNAICPVDFVTL